MSKRLIVQNNLFYLPQIAGDYDEIIYVPIYKSLIQKDFFVERFSYLKDNFKNVSWAGELELNETDAVLAWDALFEKQAFGKHLLPIQNRLLTKQSFDVTGPFTKFRKMVEPTLPEFYDDAITPFDKEVIEQLEYYFEKEKLASSYFETRNELVGRDFSTKFSAFLSSGSLDVKYLYNKIKDFEQSYGANKSTYWLVFELLWREFFYWHYQDFERCYFSKNGLQENEYDFSSYPVYTTLELKKMTKNEFFHSALNELTSTGFLSNRARQLFASFWINDLELEWRSGASLFEEYLIDYDVYSNYGNWMYLAGVGVDPRGKRYFNTQKQLSFYDPENSYVSTWYEKNS